jgi:hypothetical protein
MAYTLFLVHPQSGQYAEIPSKVYSLRIAHRAFRARGVVHEATASNVHAQGVLAIL